MAQIFRDSELNSLPGLLKSLSCIETLNLSQLPAIISPYVGILYKYILKIQDAKLAELSIYSNMPSLIPYKCILIAVH